jgi:Arc/MetJ family transcription regulator
MKGAYMRTNIDIDDGLMKKAMKTTGIETKKGVVEYALKEVISLGKRRKLADYRGKLSWEGDLDTMRSTR